MDPEAPGQPIPLLKFRRDAQRGRVYRWETELAKEHEGQLSPRVVYLEPPFADLFMRACWECLDRPRHNCPQLHHVRAKHAYYDYRRHRISVPHGLDFPMLIAHETAHAAIWRYMGILDHGPEFVRAYSHLLVHQVGIEVRDVFDSLERHKVRW